MKICEARKKYIFSTKIELDGGEFVELREPNMKEFQQFSEDGTKNLDILGKIFPACVISSSYTDDDGVTAATGQQLKDLFSDSSTTFTDILQRWFEACPFQSNKKKDKK